MKLVFWQNVPSAHLIDFMSSIHKVNHDYNVILVVDSLSDNYRESMGWNFFDKYENIEILVAPNRGETKKILLIPQAIHIISGFKGFPHYKLVLDFLKTGQIFGGFLMERPILWGMKGWLRRLFRFWYEGKYARSAKFIFTFGEDAIFWYRSSGFQYKKIFPFLYTVSPTSHSNLVEPLYKKSEDWFDIVFVGSIIERKGVDILIKSLSKLSKSLKYRLHIIGDGDQKKHVVELIQGLELSDKVFFYGYQPNEISRATIAVSDLLVLPSRFDGWGAVVNEALTQGVPVICTNKCGASSLLLNNPSNGVIVDENDPTALSKALKLQIENGKTTDKQRQVIIKWAEHSITPHVAAEYFLERLKIISNNDSYSGCNAPPWEK